ncbi:DNA double-strand break repair nuclease NurA [Leptolyngbya sp. FACHB-321]|uniref:DNA double-strand break repair nuclease NurA n=1 Tax=Leptolyngbya sp. FACHB-321 TaxID=2692807 RepID=UPI0016880C5E|nr:DNA double-strand break repair nuclease NurA [Leptolyngbya sp. FACHB-321]MBD2034995.1 DNA double-strand break repair nuclease NurA [Leptolyngbya sp. FACHB-321]
MLDLTKLAQQMQGISQQLTLEATATKQRLERAQTLLGQAHRHQDVLVEQQQTWRDRLSFTAAAPVESLNLRGSISVPPAAHTVLATDGSQIAPSHHEIAYCYLINVGRIVLHYGQNRLPLLDSLPEVFYRPEDLYVSRQWGIRTEEWMGYRRTVSEAIVLAELGEEIRRQEAEGRRQKAEAAGEVREDTETWRCGDTEAKTFQNSKLRTSQLPTPDSRLPTPPSLAMVDGSLIYWFLDSLPGEARDRILPPILDAWEKLRTLGIPLVGYISASRSGEALNFLRLQACPYDTPDCPTHCSGLGDREGFPLAHAPCQVLEPLKDAALWAMELKPGQRSPLWRSSARILELYGNHHIYFCYVHVGTEIARIEFPAWVAEDANLLDTALSLTLAQVQKGYGYPVALAEAHNQAVVRGGDRSRFFALLEQQMIRAGLKNVGTSYKEARKRGSIA